MRKRAVKKSAKYYASCAIPKPERARTVKGRKKRAEAAQIRRVRAKCVERDGLCRLMGVGPCFGVSEWAHLRPKTRAHTRGLPPEERHQTAYSAQMCTAHHYAYDAGDIKLEPLTDKGADGPMSVKVRGEEYAYAC